MPIWKGITWKVVAIEPNHYLMWESKSGLDSYALALYPIDASQTRLIWRVHNASYLWTSPFVIPQVFSDLADVIAVRQNMLGIKEQAEGAVLETPAVTYTELALWLVAFFGFLVAEVGFVVRRDWLRPLLAVVSTGLITIGLVLVKPPLWIDGLVVVDVCVGLWGMYRPVARGRRLRNNQISARP